ncbi:hypothetical protein MJO29_008356 [Puccinia striiformis f. sp. tritici]|uniref:Reverse transcriptase domain-containing protein n=1 Tax=Puccinia striiformis f. sp. tritici PST-78 TaxID=1165861 RepID=A0A0L0VG51_9BASI|nr:hypothetical protein MJO29_008356 [Puccinia striiformis f. sp. tritici]KNE98280.1 hypothetical protein PSTG_08554 [Puccinia striiformis f. sp. tritici PST-78]
MATRFTTPGGDALRYFTPPNHQSADQAREKVEASLEKEIAAGRMFGPFTHEELQERYPFFRSNPLGAVVNNDGSVRPINDLSFPRDDIQIPSVNSFVNKEDFTTTWDDFEKVSRFFRRQTEPLLLAIFDWEKAYRQIPTAKSQWPYLLIKDFEGKLYIDTRIAFGGVAGCGSFGRPADAWKLLMLLEFKMVNVFRWVDDNLFVKKITDTTEMEQIVERSEELGVKTNVTKYKPFQEEQQYIGFIWNATRKTVRLPSDRRMRRIHQIEEFLIAEAQFSFRQVEKMAGRLNHVTYILPQLRCYLNSLYSWMIRWTYKNQAQAVPKEARIDLQYWLDTMLRYEETRMIQNPDPTEIGWVGDASTGYGIGIVIGRRWAQFKLAEGWQGEAEEKRDIAWLETVAVRLGLVALRQFNYIPGKTLIVWTDNTTTENVIKNRKSKQHCVNEEWKKIQDFLVDSELDIVSKRVTSEQNKADTLSRGDRSRHDLRYQIAIQVPDDLRPMLYQI